MRRPLHEVTQAGGSAYGRLAVLAIAVSSIEEGLFLVKRSESKSRRLRGARV